MASTEAGGFALRDRSRLPKQTGVTRPQPVVRAPDMPPGARGVNGTAERLAVYAGLIHTVGQGTIRDGVVLIEKGKVKHVGTRNGFALPPGTPVLTAAVVTPGLIDAHSVMGLSGALNTPRADQDQDELSDPNQADLRVLDGFNPNEPLLQFVREQGVTVIHALPGGRM